MRALRMNNVASGYLQKTGRHMRRMVRVARRPGIERKAEWLARVFLGRDELRVRVPGDTAWVSFDAFNLPGMGGALKKVIELGEKFVQDEARWKDQKQMPRSLTKTDDLLNHREILDLALHEDLLRAAADYLGQVPRLYRVALWFSPPNQTQSGSQLFHYDHRDFRQAKVFINLRDVPSEAGPLHFVGADLCEKYNQQVGYTQRKIADEDVLSVAPLSEIRSSIGRAGQSYIVDTARCLHYGSRGNSIGRLIMMINYTRVNCVYPGKGCPILAPVREEIARTRYAADPVRTFALTAPL